MDTYITKSFRAIEQTLRDIRPELLKNHGVIVHDKKEDASVVTELDKRVELELKNALRILDESIGFYGEEFGVEGNTETFWTIDPIDGTEAFIRGMPFCTNMLCLISDGEPQAALIYNFVLDELYTAIKDKGAYLNGIPIYVSSRNIKHACVEFEIKPTSFENREKYFAIPRYSNVKFAAAGFGFCLVASGRIEARVTYDSFGKIWDYAPGVLLVKEAGGYVSNIGTSEYDYKNLNLIASNKHVYNDLVEFFSTKA